MNKLILFLNQLDFDQKSHRLQLLLLILGVLICFSIMRLLQIVLLIIYPCKLKQNHKLSVFYDIANLSTLSHIIKIAQIKSGDSQIICFTGSRFDQFKLCKLSEQYCTENFHNLIFVRTTSLQHHLKQTIILYWFFTLNWQSLFIVDYYGNSTYSNVNTYYLLLLKKLARRINKVELTDDGSLFYLNFLHFSSIYDHHQQKYKLFIKYLNDQLAKIKLQAWKLMSKKSQYQQIEQIFTKANQQYEFVNYPFAANSYLANQQVIKTNQQIIYKQIFIHYQQILNHGKNIINLISQPLDLSQRIEALNPQQLEFLEKFFSQDNSTTFIPETTNQYLLVLGTSNYEKGFDLQLTTEMQFKVLDKLITQHLSDNPQLNVIFKAHPVFKNNDQLIAMLTNKYATLKIITNTIPLEIFLYSNKINVTITGFYSTSIFSLSTTELLSFSTIIFHFTEWFSQQCGYYDPPIMIPNLSKTFLDAKKIMTLTPHLFNKIIKVDDYLTQ